MKIIFLLGLIINIAFGEINNKTLNKNNSLKRVVQSFNGQVGVQNTYENYNNYQSQQKSPSYGNKGVNNGQDFDGPVGIVVSIYLIK